MTDLTFDFPGVRVGIAEYPDGPTGCTAFLLPGECRTAVDARGGSVGIVGGFPVNSALCFSGGSIHGFPAISGVAAELLERNGNATGFADLQLVSGAVVYDFAGRDNTVAPDAELGRAAARAARPGIFPAGRCGAGRNTTVGKLAAERAEFAGQGMACGAFGAARVFVATVVNAVGVIVDREGAIVRGNRSTVTGERRHLWHEYAEAAATATPQPTPGATPRSPR